MTKFGKEFRKYQVKAWKNSYINYKALKQEIKAIKSNIEQSKLKSKAESTIISDIGHPSLKPLELVPEDSIAVEVQDLHSLYNIRYGGELKRFIELLENEFRKCYIHFVNQEKELYKRVNGHSYSISNYRDYIITDICNELKGIRLTVVLAKQLNCFINDNVMALKKILKKFDKKFQRYFGIIAPKYILTHLTSQNSDLEYLLQFKLIDEASSICENNLNILLNIYKNLKGNNANNQNNINLIEADNAINTHKNKIYEYLDMIDELTYFKIQYREWFYYAKQNQRIVKNNPKIYENDIYNPILSSTYNKDSLLEKCISSKNAIKEVEKSQSRLSHGNTTNLALIYIQACLYGSLITSIFPILPNYFEKICKYYFDSFFLIPLIVTYCGQLLPYTLFIFLDNKDKKNNFMYFSYMISYVLIFLSSLLFFFVVEEEGSIRNIILIIISRLLLGFAHNKMINKKYITLYLPKFRLSKFSKIYLIMEMIGMILGPLIVLVIYRLGPMNSKILKYSKFNCVGWYGVAASFAFGIIHMFFFIKPLGNYFVMVEDEGNITGNKYYQRSESEISRKQYVQEQNKMYKKTYNTIKKKQKENNNNINKDNNDVENLIIKNVSKEDVNEKENKNDVENLIIKNVIKEDINEKEKKKEKEKEKEKDDDENIIKTNNDLEEKLIDENDKKDESFDSENLNNSLDVSGTGGNIALTDKQKNMINEIEKVLEKRNEECNFNDMNQIPKAMNSILNREKTKFGYMNQNLLILFIIFFISSVIKINLILNYLYYIQEKISFDDIDALCLLTLLLFLFKIFSIFFIFPFYQVNYKFKKFIVITSTLIVLLNLPLIIEDIYDNKYAFIILNILMVLACNITDISCSCYLSFLLSPDWKFLGKGVGYMTNYVILGGKIIGGIICLFLCNKEYTNHWVLVGITFAFFIFILILSFFTRILRIRGITRVIRKNALEINVEQ